MKRTITFISVLALMMSLLAVVPALAENPDHCPGANEGNADPMPEGYTAEKIEANQGNQSEINSYVPPAGTVICIKSGGQDAKATGIFIVDDSGRTLQEWLYFYNIRDGSGTQGRDVSYYMVYTPPIPPLGALAVAKTAAGSVDRTVTWDLDKKVNGQESVSFSGGPGDSWTPDWEIAVTKSQALGNYMVTGSIVVSWTGIYGVTVDVSDPFPGAVIDCDLAAEGNQTQIVFPAGTTQRTCSFSAPGDPALTSNTATATPVAGSTTIPVGYMAPGPLPPAASDTANFTYVENLIGYDSATLTDDRFPMFSESISTLGVHPFTLPETFACSTDLADYGSSFSYTQTFVNTARLTFAENVFMEDSASVTITCTWPYQGLTPGFWKQSQHFDFWTNYTPEQLVGSVFLVNGSGVDGSATLLQALDWSSGNTLVAAKQKMVRQAVAALLNAAHPDVEYPLTEAQIKAEVNTLLQSNSRDAVNAYANLLDGYNNLGNVDLKG
jgi:hypothetical protein